MKVFVTRPQPDADRLAAGIAALGHEPVVDPLLSIEFLHGAEIPDLPYQAVLATSANGLRALAASGRLNRLLSAKLLAVGPASARLARELGFANVLEANGNVAALCALAAQTLKPDGGPLLYATGKARSGDLKADLDRDGFETIRAEIYQAHKAEHLSPDVINTLKDGSTCAVVLYSPRTAKTWTQLVSDAGLINTLSDCTHLCLSQAVSDVLRRELTPEPAITVVNTPDDSAMLNAIKQL